MNTIQSEQKKQSQDNQKRFSLQGDRGRGKKVPPHELQKACVEQLPGALVTNETMPRLYGAPDKGLYIFPALSRFYYLG